MLKQHILIKNNIPLGLAVNAAAHAGLIGYLEFQELPETKEWLEKSFKKVTCSVTPTEFETLKTHFVHSKIVTESALGGEEVAIVLAPMDKVPKVLKALPLYGSEHATPVAV